MMNSFYKALFPVSFACCTLAFVACGDEGSDFLQAPYGKAGPVVPDSSDDVSSSSARWASSSSLASSSSVLSSSSIAKSYVGDTLYNSFTDKRDGEVYRVVKIGDQVWMAENLRYRDKVATPSLEGHSWSIADDCASSGCLYDFSAVMDNPECADSFCIVENPHRGICPEGFHVPTEGEWKVLLAEASDQGVSLNDSAGFASAPTGEFAGYVRSDECARFWTATQSNSDGAYEYYRCREETTFRGQSYTKFFGYALRCVADAGEVKLDKFVEVSVPSSSSVSSSSSEESSSSSVESSSSAESSSSEVSSSSLSSSSEVSSSSVSSSSAWDPYSHGEDWNSLEQITDERDGNKYRVVQVNEFIIWMAENLRYADSTATPALVGNTACIGANGERCEEGNLYTYAAAVNDLECATKVCFESEKQVRGICPEGWRLPKKADWNWLGYALNDGSVSFDAAGMLPTGERNGNGIVKYDGYARFWLVEEDAGSSAFEGYYYAGDHLLQKQSYMKSFGYAVRCVKDVE